MYKLVYFADGKTDTRYYETCEQLTYWLKQKQKEYPDFRIISLNGKRS